MKKTLLVVALLASAPAFADECRGNCAPNTNGVTPNVQVTPNITPVISPLIAPVISPDIRNTNLNAQDQRQAQGQLQGQNQSAVATGGAGGTGGVGIGGVGIGGVGVGGAGGAGGLGGAGGSSNQTQTATGGASSSTSAAASAATNAGVSQGVTVNNNTPDKLRTVGQAGDIITSPTAPCRIAIGVSGGWMGGALSIGSSTLDEGCDLRETSRTLYNGGHKDAATQIMCLHDAARKALEATGVVCKIAKTESEATPK